MIVEAMESYAKFNGPWLQAWSDANAAATASARIAFGQLELATLTSRFMTQRIRAYADYDGRLEPLVRRLDQLTEQYGEDYARELRQIYSAWSDLLREDRAVSQAMPSPLRGADPRDLRADAERGETEKPRDTKVDAERGEKEKRERRPVAENPRH
jgi:hypothetical protein